MPWLVVNGCMKYFRDDDPKYEALKEQQNPCIKPKKRKRTKKSKCECADESCICC